MKMHCFSEAGVTPWSLACHFAIFSLKLALELLPKRNRRQHSHTPPVSFLLNTCHTELCMHFKFEN